jgi:NAD(P)-dependent dehydrogenase (short-subunit alcohol dehydrogenase family)
MTPSKLENQTVLIIGAGRWPGPSLALAFANEGANVAINDLSPILLDPVCEAAEPLPGKIKSYVADATRGMPLRAMLDEVIEDWGKIDILINNPRILPETPIIEMDEWDWQRTVEMNLNGPFLVSKLVAREMREKGHGMIFNIIDTTEAIHEPGRAAYAASQSGLWAFSQAAAQELIAYNIHVYSLCPDREVLHTSRIPSELVAALLRNPQELQEAVARTAVSLCNQAPANPPGQAFLIHNHSTKPITRMSEQE